jgi:alkylation response protein AidB-like acyl-CoA dehydrogenase
MGSRVGDLGELFFDNVRVPVGNLIGPEGRGLSAVMPLLDTDRLQIGAWAIGACELAFETTVEFARERKAFGQRLLDFQNTQFKLAEIKTEIEVGRAFLRDLVRKYQEKTLTNNETAMAKWWLAELEGRVMDTCLQLHGGAGFMEDTLISQLYTAARVHRIYVGTTEIMKLIIGRSLG